MGLIDDVVYSTKVLKNEELKNQKTLNYDDIIINFIINYNEIKVIKLVLKIIYIYIWDGFFLDRCFLLNLTVKKH